MKPIQTETLEWLSPTLIVKFIIWSSVCRVESFPCNCNSKWHPLPYDVTLGFPINAGIDSGRSMQLLTSVTCQKPHLSWYSRRSENNFHVSQCVVCFYFRSLTFPNLLTFLFKISFAVTTFPLFKPFGDRFEHNRLLCCIAVANVPLCWDTSDIGFNVGLKNVNTVLKTTLNLTIRPYSFIFIALAIQTCLPEQCLDPKEKFT